MPREKKTRNPLGAIIENKVTKEGKTRTAYDAKKRYTNRDGKPAQKFRRCWSKSEAQAALMDFAAEIKAELNKTEQEIQKDAQKTFLDLTSYFRKEYLIKAKIVDGRIIEGYRQDIKRLANQITDMEMFFGDIPLVELNYERLRQYKIYLSTQPKKHDYTDDPPKPATVNRKLSMLSKILNVGTQLGWFAFNPFKAGKPLIEKRAENRRTRILTFEEERRIFDICNSDDTVETVRSGRPFRLRITAPRRHLILPITMALDTAMRQSEVFSVERGQIDLDRLTISLRAEQTKAFRARQIPITDRLAELLKIHFSENRLASKDKVMLGMKTPRRAFENVLQKAEIENFTWHDLRASAITWMDLAGLTENVKKNIVGHSTGEIHQRYHRLSDDVLEDAREKLNEFRRKIDAQFDKKEQKQAA